jgi:hypothetical protein
MARLSYRLVCLAGTLLLSLIDSFAYGQVAGKYVCVTDYAAGVVEHQDGTVAEGKLALPPEKQRFFVTIREFTFRGTVENCFSKDQIDALKNYKADALKDVDEMVNEFKHHLDDIASNKNVEAYDPEDYAGLCLASFGAEVGGTRGMSSINGREFFSVPKSKPYKIFWLDYIGSALKFYVHDMETESCGIRAPCLARSDYVYRGRCEKVQ